MADVDVADAAGEAGDVFTDAGGLVATVSVAEASASAGDPDVTIDDIEVTVDVAEAGGQAGLVVGLGGDAGSQVGGEAGDPIAALVFDPTAYTGQPGGRLLFSAAMRYLVIGTKWRDENRQNVLTAERLREQPFVNLNGEF